MNALPSVTLPGTDITTSRIGFGCNALLGTDRTRRQALELLETAFEMGIRHFDVARSYEAGDSEEVLGVFARDKRDRITITSKFRVNHGGDFHRESASRAWLRRRLRTSPVVLGVRPLLKKVLGRGDAPSASASSPSAAVPAAEPAGVRPPFDIALARQSLETTLRELRTDYLDLFFVHEGEVEDARSDELRAFLAEAKAAGKVRQYGFGSSYGRIRRICEAGATSIPVMQFESSLLYPHVAPVRAFGPRAILTHGAMASLPALRAKIAGSAALAKELRTLLDADPDDTATLSNLLLRFALRENPEGVTLFRSSRPANIRANLNPDRIGRTLPETVWSDLLARLSDEPVGETGTEAGTEKGIAGAEAYRL
ncbi:MAG: aldo/keto reductase [Capsulimonadales bacterium]|nr:aldo/keto reductase [Capsulimonadales bacterium]